MAVCNPDVHASGDDSIGRFVSASATPYLLLAGTAMTMTIPLGPSHSSLYTLASLKTATHAVYMYNPPHFHTSLWACVILRYTFLDFCMQRSYVDLYNRLHTRFCCSLLFPVLLSRSFSLHLPS